MKEYLETIKNTTLLKSLSINVISDNIEQGNFIIKTYAKDNTIHLEAERCEKVEVILSGNVVVERMAESGELLVVSEFVADDILGGNILFSKNPYYPLTVSSLTKTIILEINKVTVIKLLQKNSDLMLTYLEFISDHTGILGDKIKTSINITMRDKITSYLEYESRKQNSNYIDLTMTKTKLAEKFGVQRTSLSRELNKMRKEGLIEYKDNTNTILLK